jgi:glycosyltransferase involved in cell wall biosynthesis
MPTKVLFVEPWKSTFIERDKKIIEKHFDLRVLRYELTFKDLRKSVFFLFTLLKDLLWADIVFVWFAGFHAYLIITLSKMIQTKVVVVVGGYEVAGVSKIQYGAALNVKDLNRVKYVLRKTDKLIAVSMFNKKEILKIEPNAKPGLIYNAIDTQAFFPGSIVKENIVITVAVISEKTILRKGLVTFIKAAIGHPESKFVVIGGCGDGSIEELISIAPKNVEFTGFINDRELLRWYQRAKVYCQLSVYESFGVALAESMSCCCVPVVTPEGALPEVVGETGFYAPYGDVEATEVAIGYALKSDNGKYARERAIDLFAVEKREEKIVSIINDVAEELG